MAAIVGIGVGVPMNAAGWAEGAVLTLTRTMYATLVRDWVVLAGDVAGGTDGGGAQLPAAGGQRLIQICRPPNAPSGADIPYWDTQRPKLVCAVVEGGRAAIEVSMALDVYLGRLDPNFVATRWQTATAAGARSGTAPLGSAPKAPQVDARTVDMSGPGDAALREIVAILTPAGDQAAQEAIDRGRPLLSSAARAMAAISSEFRAFAMLVASQNTLTDLQIQAALTGWRSKMLFAWADDEARAEALTRAGAVEGPAPGASPSASQRAEILRESRVLKTPEQRQPEPGPSAAAGSGAAGPSAAGQAPAQAPSSGAGGSADGTALHALQEGLRKAQEAQEEMREQMRRQMEQMREETRRELRGKGE